MSTPREIPESSVLQNAAELDVYDVTGRSVKFGSIFENQKVVVVFIRHFICGICQMYVQQLASVKQEALSKAEVKLVVIGCGEWKAIKPYAGESFPCRSHKCTTYSQKPTFAEITGFQGDFYADPTRELYHTLGMTIETLQATPSGATKRSYITEGRLTNIYTSISRAFRNPSMIGKQGNISQLGGDFVLGPGLQCSFASRMQNTEDHVEVAELMKAAGVEYVQVKV